MDCQYDKISIFDKSFWDLWVQKLLRNLASVKYQFMLAFFYIVVHGMFIAKDAAGEPLIGVTEGLAFLSGGFITLATSRLVVRTSLFEDHIDPRQKLDTDK